MATKNTTPAALTDDQYRLVLETIAGRMATLHQLIMVANGEGYDDFVRNVCADAAEALAVSIGAMADEAVGADVIGDASRWLYGPNFTDAGRTY